MEHVLRSGSERAGRSSWATPNWANNGLKHQPALYSRDKGQELGWGWRGLLTSLVPAGHAHGRRCWNSLGWAWNIPLTPLLLTGQLLAPAQGD